MALYHIKSLKPIEQTNLYNDFNYSVAQNYDNQSLFNNFQNFNIDFNISPMPMLDYNKYFQEIMLSYQKHIQQIQSNIMNFSNNNFSSQASLPLSRDGAAVLAKAESYIGKVNSDEEGNNLFSPKGYKNTSWYKKHGQWGWCADFATYCASQTLGSKYPSSMKTSSPHTLIKEANRNNCYSANWSGNAQPGDIIITKSSAATSGMHVSILKSINSDGSITTISGNSKDKVGTTTYKTQNVIGVVNLANLG